MEEVPSTLGSRPAWRDARLARLLFDHDLLFLAGVIAALVWVNLDPASLEATTAPLRFPVNQLLMALFFGVATGEIAEAARPGGSLSSLRRAALPLVATAGGMVGPIALYTAGCAAFGLPSLHRGWAIPTATDVAASAMVARFVFGARHPAIPFLLLLAIADDAAGLLVLAVGYPQGELRGLMLLGLLVAGAACFLLRRLSVGSPWPYLLLGGGASWFALHEGGLHPALALVPIVPFMPAATARRFARAAGPPVAVILGLFGLVNAGVPLAAAGPATWLVLVGLLLGKPLGICAAVVVGVRLLGLELPEGLRARDVVVLGVTAGIGFTVALFVATVAFPAVTAGPTLEAAKMGALGSVAAAPLAILLAKVVGTTRQP